MKFFLIIGVFAPVINWCGGAELVAINVINSLKEHGHQVIVLTDNPLNQDKFAKVFNETVLADEQLIFPLAFFPQTNYHNIYTDAIRSLMLKSKCELLIDTYSCALLPGVDACYIHYPMLKKVENLPHRMSNRIYFSPYRSFLNSSKRDINNKLFFANSKFTADAVKTEFGLTPHILYPPVSTDFLNHNEKDSDEKRDNAVITVARISKEKNLKIIPYIANLTRNISFTIVGLLDSIQEYNSLLMLIKELGVSDKVKILTNVKRNHLRGVLRNSKVYLHTSVNEHFGISIVEAMASGCIPIVHNSGGPKEFVPSYLRYELIEEAAQKINKAIENWSPKEAHRISKYANKFSENNFSERFIKIFNSFRN